MYGLTRASWNTAEFAKNYPAEKQYRHTLKEEAAALRAAIRPLTKRSKTLRRSIDRCNC